MKRRNRALLLLAAGSLGFLAVSGGAVLLRRPDLRKELVERWRYGTVSDGGLVLTLEREPGGALTAVFTNVSGSERRLLFTEGDRLGKEELDVTVTDERNEEVPPVLTPPEGTPLTRARRVAIEPGRPLRLPLDLARFVALPGPGRYRVSVRRATMYPDEPHLASNVLVVDTR
jgi:hypothetical protein